MILRASYATKWNQSRTADVLNLKRDKLRYRMKMYRSTRTGAPGIRETRATIEARKRHKTVAGALLLGFAVLGCSCAYTTSTAQLPSHLRTVAVPVFENSTAEYNLEQDVTAAVIAALRPGQPSQGRRRAHGGLRRAR